MDGDSVATDELNVFLRTQKVLSVDKVAVVDQGRHYWSVCVEYLPRKAVFGSGGSAGGGGGGGMSNRPRIDYREELGKEEFERYSALRDLRKQVVQREGVPGYALFTNAQLTPYSLFATPRRGFHARSVAPQLSWVCGAGG